MILPTTTSGKNHAEGTISTKSYTRKLFSAILNIGGLFGLTLKKDFHLISLEMLSPMRTKKLYLKEKSTKTF